MPGGYSVIANLLIRNSYTHSHTNGTAIRSDSGFSILPEDTCYKDQRSQGLNHLLASRQPTLRYHHPKKHTKNTITLYPELTKPDKVIFKEQHTFKSQKQ